MDLLSKFDAIQIQGDNRITDADLDYCIAHQNAYDAARSCFQELIYIWEDLTAKQTEFLDGIKADSSGKDCYLPDYDSSLKISVSKIREHIINLHTRFIRRLVEHFNREYQVSVEASQITEHLLPEKPSNRYRANDEENNYEGEMLRLSLHYEDILNELFVQLDGRSFREQALHELKEKCHSAAWISSGKALYEIKKDVLYFSCGCSYESWFRSEHWDLRESLKHILRGVAHYETGSFSTLPTGFSSLLGYNHSDTDVVPFPTCTKVRQIRMFKNGRVDIKFFSESAVRTFVAEYLGQVY